MYLVYSLNSSQTDDILIHLEICSSSFIPDLSETVNIAEYATKLAELAIKFEAWDGNQLVGLIAAYFNDFENKAGFITNVSVLPKYSGKGIGKKLMENAIRYAIENSFPLINLRVNKNNFNAISLYKKFNFEEISLDNNYLVMQLNIKKYNYDKH